MLTSPPSYDNSFRTPGEELDTSKQTLSLLGCRRCLDDPEHSSRASPLLRSTVHTPSSRHAMTLPGVDVMLHLHMKSSLKEQRIACQTQQARTHCRTHPPKLSKPASGNPPRKTCPEKACPREPALGNLPQAMMQGTCPGTRGI